MDDGACDHLGREPFLTFPPNLNLSSTDGSMVNLSARAAEPIVLFFYPRTGVPGQPPNLGFALENWDSIPGAWGCTPQCCGFRDTHAEFARRGVTLFGIGTNTSDHQREFTARQHIPFQLLSDSSLGLVRAMRLPTFDFPVESGGPTTLIRRMAIFCDAGRIVKVWYPVFPPDQNAAQVLHWLAHRPPLPALQNSRDHRAVSIRRIEPRDLAFVRRELTRNWNDTEICSLGIWHAADSLPGFVATRGDGPEPVGLLTHTPPAHGCGCEVITLSCSVEGAGVGSMLLAAAVEAARAAGCSRVFLTTTNDNLRAIGFYQKRGWSLVAVHRGAMDEARKIKPSISRIGMHGVPLRDELELETVFERRP